MIKIITLFRRRPGISHQECIEYWRSTHARLAQSDHEFWSRVRKYTQNYIVSRDGSGDPEWDGVVELWFDDQSSVDAAFGSAETKAVLVADLKHFVDIDSMISVSAKERTFYDATE
jgi:uncharacterized protein (TIGR02118 family)